MDARADGSVPVSSNRCGSFHVVLLLGEAARSRLDELMDFLAHAPPFEHDLCDIAITVLSERPWSVAA